MRWTQRIGAGCRRIGHRMPSRCLLCGGRGDAGADLCAGCRRDMPENACCCARCALPLVHALAECGHCQRHPPPWQRAWVPYRYAWPLNRLETRYKFSAQLAAGRVLAQLWCARPPPELPAAMLAVPLHRARLRQRGYDQAHELARQVAATLGLPLLGNALRRVRVTRAQSDLDAAARRRNVRDAFAVRGAVDLPGHVALFDDVMTTGATLGACTRALRRAGVGRVDVWAVARVARPAGAGVHRKRTD